jgi:hypothetical protein
MNAACLVWYRLDQDFNLRSVGPDDHFRVANAAAEYNNGAAFGNGNVDFVANDFVW